MTAIRIFAVFAAILNSYGGLDSGTPLAPGTWHLADIAGSIAGSIAEILAGILADVAGRVVGGNRAVEKHTSAIAVFAAISFLRQLQWWSAGCDPVRCCSATVGRTSILPKLLPEFLPILPEMLPL